MSAPIFDKVNLLGLDLSHYEPALDWKKAKDGGVSWMYTKATEGLGIKDQSLKLHMQGAQGEGLPASAYHFFHASESGKDQADYFLHSIQGLKLDFAPILDWENASANGCDAETQSLRAHSFLDEVEKELNVIPWIYTGAFYIGPLSLHESFARYPLIIAGYGSHPTVPKPWKNLNAWQFTDAYAPHGIQYGYHCDANVFYGSIDDLKSLGQKAKPNVLQAPAQG